EPFIKLNGRYMLQLGQLADVINHSFRGKGEQRIRIALTNDDGNKWNWQFSHDDPESLVLGFRKRPEADMPELLTAYYVYLTAERIGPRLALPMNSLPRQALHVGVQGEYTAQVLAQNILGKKESSSVRRELLHPD